MRVVRAAINNQMESRAKQIAKLTSDMRIMHCFACGEGNKSIAKEPERGWTLAKSRSPQFK